MSRKLTRIAVLGVLLCSVVAFAPRAQAAALHRGGRQQTWQHTSVERIVLPVSVCDARKAANPTQANNPELCVIIHTAKWNDFQSTEGISTQMLGISPDLVIGGGGCAQGQQPYDDNYTDPLSSNIEMQVTFQWNNDCKAPTIAFKNCWINWLLGVKVDESCTTGNPTSTSTQVMHLVHFNPYAQPWLFAGIWQKRTCYSNATCDYHTDLG